MKKFKKIYVEITNNCNLNCSFCSKNSKKNSFISLEDFEDTLKKIKDYTDYIYLHVKGEPLLHPKLKELLDIAEKYNLKVNITTNGTLLEEKINDLNMKCINKVNISLHCENKIKDYFEKVFHSVDSLNNCTVVYRIWTLDNGKLDEKSTVIVNKIIKNYNLSTDFVDKLKNNNNIKIKDNIYLDKDNQFDWPDNLVSGESKGYCIAPKTHIAILVDGTVVPCCLDSNGIIDLGNIHKNTLEEILNSEKYLNLKKSFNDRKPCEELCKKCTFKNRFN